MPDITKAVIDIGNMHLSLEGSEAFVRGEIERFSEALISCVGQSPDVSDEEIVTDPPKGTAPADSPPAPKRARARATHGAGQGCTSKVTALLTEGFFKTGKTTTEVQSELKTRATPYAKNKISASLINFAKAGKLRRYDEAGDWRYMVP